MVARSLICMMMLLLTVAPASAERLFVPDAGGRAASVTLRLDTAIARDLASRPRATIVTDVPLVGGGSASFALAPLDVFTPDAKVVEFDGVREHAIPRPDVAVYEGAELGTPGRTMVLTIAGGARVSALVRDGQRVVSMIQPVASGGRAAGDHTLVDPANAPAGPPRDVCKHDLGPAPALGAASAGSATFPRTPPFSPTLAGEVLVDVGNDLYVNQFGSSSTTAAEYAAGVLGAVSGIWRRDVNVAVVINQLVIWTAPDPFAGADSAEQLTDYQSWNEANRVGVPRDFAHLLANIGDGGRAYLGSICTSFAYGVSNLDGFYSAFPTTGYEWDVNVVAHEIGHNYGSPHTHCYMPPLDHCYNTEAGCYAGPVEPSTGETMSYCHLNATIEMGFGGTVGSLLRAGAEANGCIGAPPGVCGNGVLEPGEPCDDGNTSDGDCCASNCVAETGDPCATDGNTCTTDVCSEAGICTHVPPGSCTPCAAATTIPAAGGSFPGTTLAVPSAMTGSCGGGGPERVFAWTPAATGLAHVSTCGSDYATAVYVREGTCESGSEVSCSSFSSCGRAQVTFYAQAGTTYYLVLDSMLGAGHFELTVSPPGCAPTPLAGCKTPTASGKASFKLKNLADDGKDQLAWSWGSGAATTMEELGNPMFLDGYQLCIYGAGSNVVSAAAPPGGSCAGKPCWKSKTSSHAYNDKLLTPNGIQQLQLKASSVPGKAKIGLKGKGGLLALPSLAGIVSPVRVQLSRPGGPCWEATFNAPTLKPDGSQLSGKSN